MPEGQYTRLGTLCHKHHFRKHINLIVVDEIHLIHTAGMPRHGLPAFCPSYGWLDELKALFGKTPWLVLTATPPLYMLKTVESKVLSPNYIHITLSSNRPNTMYATHQVDDIKDWNNYRCFICEPFDPATQPRVLIFLQSAELCSACSLGTIASGAGGSEHIGRLSDWGVIWSIALGSIISVKRDI